MKILIIGGGLAGRLLSWFLVKEGASITLVDDPRSDAATRVSAGIIMPVTGRRIVKTANAGNILPFAFNFYRKMQSLAQNKIFSENNILHLFNSEGNRNDWLARSAEPDMQGYLGEVLTQNQMHPAINAPFGGMMIGHSGMVRPDFLEKTLTEQLTASCHLINTHISPAEWAIGNGHVCFRSEHFDRMILCQGHEATKEPLTSWIPFKPAKGEILDFITNDLPDDKVIIGNGYVEPLDNGRFRAGSTYEWEQLDALPTEKARSTIIEIIEQTVKCNYSITGHQAGIRPAMIDRRPVIGFHPGHPEVGIFNGLGAKGVMQGPYYANMAAACFLGVMEPDADVDLRRFSKYYQSH